MDSVDQLNDLLAKPSRRRCRVLRRLLAEIRDVTSYQGPNPAEDATAALELAAKGDPSALAAFELIPQQMEEVLRSESAW